MASAPSMVTGGLQTLHQRLLLRLELWLEAERDHLPLWLPVMLGAGIAAWFSLPLKGDWHGVIGFGLAVALAGFVAGKHWRHGQALFWSGLLLSAGCALIWVRADMVAEPVLARPLLADVAGVAERVERRAAEGKVRITIAPDDPALPPSIRISAKLDAVPTGLTEGARLRLRARLAHPPGPALPGGYDFARAAWFRGLGATGTALGKVEMDGVPPPPPLRVRLAAHVHEQIKGSAGGIAAAFASGDRGGIAPEDEEAMRDSGLTHLLSISGLHITAVIGATMLIVLRLLALSPALALRWPLLLIAAGAGAVAGIGYTLLTGAEVPTVRSCIAALLVLAGLALGREAFTLRMVSTGALVILIILPEALVGASFQLSFAAMVAIVAFHESRLARHWFARREEGWGRRAMRAILALMATGIVVEAALAPIALYHFNKSGLYGALANMIAIPWTTFVIMPLEAVALLLDLAGLGAPFWWLTEGAINALLALAHWVAAMPGAVAMLPEIPVGAFALMLGGGLWLLLWMQRPRWLGLVPVLAGIGWTVQTPPPDILISRDGRHVAVRLPDGRMAMLRDRAGDFIADAMASRAGEDEALPLIDGLPGSRCNADMCVAEAGQGSLRWTIGATRSPHLLPWKELIALCSQLDLIVSERRLPPACTPRVLKLDRERLRETGGVVISLTSTAVIQQTRLVHDDHPWAEAGFKPAPSPLTGEGGGEGAGRRLPPN